MTFCASRVSLFHLSGSLNGHTTTVTTTKSAKKFKCPTIQRNRNIDCLIVTYIVISDSPIVRAIFFIQFHFMSFETFFVVLSLPNKTLNLKLKYWTEKSAQLARETYTKEKTLTLTLRIHALVRAQQANCVGLPTFSFPFSTTSHKSAYN